MRELAKDFGISNVALAKRFRRLATIGLPVPGETSAQIHLTLVIRRASANRNLNGRFWESREAAAGCGFNRSRQHIEQSVLPVSRSLASSVGVRSADERWH